MTAPANHYAFSLHDAREAARRWKQREQRHKEFAEAAVTKEFGALDTPERRGKRLRRLLSGLATSAPRTGAAFTGSFAAAAEFAAASAERAAPGNKLLERIIGTTRDFQFVSFLEQAVHSSKSVGRIVIRQGGSIAGYGTGFMVSRRLMMTNHHVLDTPGVAANSRVEFNFQLDRFGQPLAICSAKLDPSSFFLNDRELDFALVAVEPIDALRDFGWCPLIRDEGKINIGEAINIVQHPKGEMKQVIIRENRLIDLLDLHAHYQADTEPGSSGSPVFNDQWEVVALHHSGVPRTDADGRWLRKDGQPWTENVDPPETLDWIANEGMRVSRLVDFISSARLEGAERNRLVRDLLDAKPPESWTGPRTRRTDRDEDTTDDRDDRTAGTQSGPGGGQSATTLTIPLRLTVSVSLQDAGSAVAASVSAVTPETLLEKIEPDPSDPAYEHRSGYDPNFLGFEVPFPRLKAAFRPQAFTLPGKTGISAYELRYHHYSVIFNKERRLAFVAGVNYDPTAPHQHRRDRDGDRWLFDPRIARRHQAGDELYRANPLDRGHLVRRADAGWGYSREEAKLANDDTFHFTNCSPQHEITNQGRAGEAPAGLALWGELENYVASQGREQERKLVIFNGPVFRDDDREYRGVRLPKEFWKVVVYQRDDGGPGAAAFVLTQAGLIEGLREDFEPGEYTAVQMSLQGLEGKTGLDFGVLTQWDNLEQEEVLERMGGAASLVVLRSPGDMLL